MFDWNRNLLNNYALCTFAVYCHNIYICWLIYCNFYLSGLKLVIVINRSLKFVNMPSVQLEGLAVWIQLISCHHWGKLLFRYSSYIFFSVTCSCWYHNVNFIGFLYFVSIEQLVFIVAHLNSVCFYWSHIENVFAQDEGVSKNFPIINNRLPRAQWMLLNNPKIQQYSLSLNQIIVFMSIIAFIGAFWILLFVLMKKPFWFNCFHHLYQEKEPVFTGIW